jgi:hypothetical protein
MTRTHPPIAFVVGCVLSACAIAPRITFVPKISDLAPAKPATCEIAVFRDGRPDRPFTELGVINFHREWHRALGGKQTVAAALPQIKMRACRAGADAVMLRVTEERRLEWAMLHVAATVIRFEAVPPQYVLQGTCDAMTSLVRVHRCVQRVRNGIKRMRRTRATAGGDCSLAAGRSCEAVFARKSRRGTA